MTMAYRKPTRKELRLSGRVASGGLIAGDVFSIEERKETGQRASKESPELEKVVLDQALLVAGQDLEILLKGLENEEISGIVEFQIAMLEDATLLEPANAAIASGVCAAMAWELAINAQIADYENAENAHFQARAADLVDIRDRVLRHLSGEAGVRIPPGSVVISDDLTPTLFLETDWSGSGIALHAGSPAGHVAILARARGIPMLVAVERRPHPVTGFALLDTDRECIVFDPAAATRSIFERRREAAKVDALAHLAFLDKPAVTADGIRIKVFLNIAQPEELDCLDPAHCDGIGLVRTEFLFRGERLPDEAAQFACYARIVKWACGRPVTIRTLDIGGDKPIPGLSDPEERNPFLGIRGFRLSRRHPEMFKAQLRALLRAAALGPVKIMVPMISVPEEMTAARRLLDEAQTELEARGDACAEAPLGMMVEVPAAALCIKDFAVDFYSIGSNDLLQYVMACGRDNPTLGDLLDSHAGVLRELIERVSRHALASDREASICGDMAADPGIIPLLIGSGLRCLSVSPAALARTKAAVARCGGTADI